MNLSALRARVTFLITAIIPLMAGCVSLNPPIPTRAEPAVMPSISVPASTPDPAIEEPTPAATLGLTATPTPDWTPEPTVTPGPSPTSDPVSLVMIGQTAHFGALQASPDGAKRAELAIYDCIATGEDPNVRQSFEILRIITLGDETEYQLDSQFINCGGLGAFGLDILGWSADSRYLLYTPHREGQPDGGCRPWARSIVLVDTVDWTHAPLDQAVASPDGTRLAGWQGRDLVLISPESGEQGRAPAPLPNEGLHPPVWSPDGSRLAYLQTSSFCPVAAGDSAVIIVDGTTLQTEVAATLGAPEFAAVEWIDPSRLRLTAADNTRWELDLTIEGLFQIP